MNARQWKKACKKAARELERLHPGVYTFTPSDREDTVDAPRGYQPPGRLGRSTFAKCERRYATPRPGTPLVVSRDYFGEDESVRTALEVLHDHLAWDDFEPGPHDDEPSMDEMLSETCRALWFVLSRPSPTHELPRPLRHLEDATPRAAVRDPNEGVLEVFCDYCGASSCSHLNGCGL